MDDSTLTRSVEYWRDSVYSHRVLTVGDCCKQILEEIIPALQPIELGSDPDAAKSALKRYAAEFCDMQPTARGGDYVPQ